MPRKPLTSIQVYTIKKPGFHRDPLTVGLYLQVARSKTGVSRSWAYRYNSPLTGELRFMGLGSVDVVSLADARKLAQDYRRMVRIERRDPIEERRSLKADALAAKAKEMTFAQCVDAYLDQHSSGWKNDKHRKQWRSTLNTACDAFGKLPVAQVDEAVIVKMLTPIWLATPETGSRLRGRIEKVLAWATVGKLREGPNPARWKDHLEFMLKAKPKSQHHTAMPWLEVPKFMELLRGKDSLSARALEFTILTAARTQETVGAHWDEIDLKAKAWTIPAERMKAKTEHKVPLSDRAVEILFGMQSQIGKTAGADLIFPLSNMAMLQMLRGTAGNGYVVHGFRSAFRDWCGERTNYARDVIEFALAHKLPDKVEAAYRRETAVEKRRHLMQAWASFCAKPVSTATVTHLHKTA
jgi:integrase